MSNINTTYTYFDTYNYTGTLSISSYALPFTEFKFKPRLDDSISSKYSIKRIIWDFGDGTTVEAVTAQHAYTEPGTYNVTCTLFDKNGTSYINSFYQRVDVYNFVNDTINISVNNTSAYVLTACRINTPIHVTNSISYQNLSSSSDNKTIIPFCSGSSVDYYQTGIYKKPYSHLYKYSAFYLLEAGLNQLSEFVEISNFKTLPTPLYCKLSGTTVVYTDVTDTNAFFCGISGYKDVYFKSDIEYSDLNLFFGYEQSSIKKNMNTSTIGIKASVVTNTSYEKLDISSNGITSEGITSDLFPINVNKFSNTKIGFVIKIKDKLNFTNKVPNINFTNSLILTDGTVTYNDTTFYTNYSELSSLNYGFIKGYFVTTIPTTANVFISAQFAEIGNGIMLTGISNKFNIYNKDYYNIAKRGEAIDMTQQYTDIAIQPLFIDNKILLTDFVGSMVGNLSSTIGTTLGKRTYEKIENFVDNNITSDYSSVNSLASIAKLLGNTNIQFDTSNYVFPCDLGRLIDTLSINFGRLRGSKDGFNQDFKTYGYQNREIYGKNIGEEIGVNYLIEAGKYLLAFEKYSGKFTILNTFLPLCASSAPPTVSTIITYNINTENNINICTEDNTNLCVEFTSLLQKYNLSSYNNTWGWGLVLPDNTSIQELNNYYTFYTYSSTTSDKLINGVINYDDVTNTLSQNISSYSEWSRQDGIISNILTNQLYTGLNLFN